MQIKKFKDFVTEMGAGGAGGGAGEPNIGGDGGGGGGAGGFLGPGGPYSVTYSLSKGTSYTVTIGGGGSGARVIASLSCLDIAELERNGYAKIGTGKYIDCP